MKKRTKIWLITAFVLVLLGFIISGGVLTVLKWDFTILSTNKYETNHHTITEAFSSISIDTDTANIQFVPSEDSQCSVVCYEQKNVTHTASVTDGTLVIKTVDTRKWYEHIGINFGAPKITVYIPQSEYDLLSIKSNTGNIEIPKEFQFGSIDIEENTGAVTNYASASSGIRIKTTTGNICVEGITAGSLTLSVSTGKVSVLDVICEGDIAIKVTTGKTELSHISCKNMVSSGSTGDISLNSVVASETLSITRSTGNVKLDGSDAAEIFVKTDTGSVKGSLLSEKIFITKTDTGSIDVPNTVTGGRCEITTGTGNIKITIEESCRF